MFWTVRHGLKDDQKMEELQMKVIDCLRDHCTYNAEAQRKPNFFSLILGKIAELRYFIDIIQVYILSLFWHLFLFFHYKMDKQI